MRRLKSSSLLADAAAAVDIAVVARPLDAAGLALPLDVALLPLDEAVVDVLLDPLDAVVAAELADAAARSRRFSSFFVFFPFTMKKEPGSMPPSPSPADDMVLLPALPR